MPDEDDVGDQNSVNYDDISAALNQEDDDVQNIDDVENVDQDESNVKEPNENILLILLRVERNAILN